MKVWLIKLIAKRIVKAIKHKHDLKKIDDYVTKPNELDKQIKSLQRTVTKYGKYIETLEKDVAILKKDSHVPIKELEKRLRRLERKKGE